jgi:glycosyltransferase involved in cell wall biosynthesis
MLNPAKKIWRVLRDDGVEVLYGKLLRRGNIVRGRRRYQQWIDKYDEWSETDRREARMKIEGFALKPLISVLMPVYNTDGEILRKAIESVRDQIYENWELCIADDRSTLGHVREVLEEYAASDRRIKVVFREENGHISEASNSALALAAGEFAALLDHDDELAPHAFYFVAKEINAYSAADIIYSDEDKIDEQGRRFSPFFKPDWSPDLLYSVNYINHLTVYRTDLLRECGGFRIGFEGSQDYDLLLRAVERTKPENIRHIPKILYHWRAVSGSVAQAADEKPYAHDRARAAIAEHLKRTGVEAKVVRGVGQLHRVIYEMPKPEPLVSVITAEDDADRIYNAVAASSRLPFELIAVGSGQSSNPGIKRVDAGNLTLFARLNRGASAASGPVLCFLSDATQVSEDWLSVVVGQVVQNGIGAVGPMIVDRRGQILNAGFTLGLFSGVASVFQAAPISPRGRALRLDVTQNVSALSAACLAIRRDVFDDVGGFDEENFGESYGDVDLCLRLIDSGRRNVWTPWATIVRAAGREANNRAALDRLRSNWAAFFTADPYYNPNLSLDSVAMPLAEPPRLEKL